MTEFDEKIRGALDADDEAFLKELEQERGLFAQVGDTLTGPLGGWAKLMFVVTFAWTIFMFYALWQMFTVEGTRELILWTAGTLFAAIAIGLIKQWFFDRMNMIAILRELKRIELRVAGLEERK